MDSIEAQHFSLSFNFFIPFACLLRVFPLASKSLSLLLLLFHFNGFFILCAVYIFCASIVTQSLKMSFKNVYFFCSEVLLRRMKTKWDVFGSDVNWDRIGLELGHRQWIFCIPRKLRHQQGLLSRSYLVTRNMHRVFPRIHGYQHTNEDFSKQSSTNSVHSTAFTSHFFSAD